MPQKLKTSFDPILAPVVTQKLAEGDKQAVAKQVRQVGFWIIAAQAGIALALGIPGEALMGLFGENSAFVGGTAALAFLLAAEVVAATAAVSEARARLCRAAPQPDDLLPDDRDPGGAHRRSHPRHALAAAGQAAAAGLSGGGRGAGAGAGARPGLDPQVPPAVAGCSARRSRAGAGR